jgi:hypothetical protein
VHVAAGAFEAAELAVERDELELAFSEEIERGLAVTIDEVLEVREA